VTTTQNNGEWAKVCALMLTFIPAMPARSAPGSSRIDASVRIFTISFVRCSVPTIRTSKVLAIPSLTSRAEASAASTLAVSATNRFADASEVGRERPSESADSTASVTEQLELFVQVLAQMRDCLHVDLIEGLFNLVEGTEVASYDPLRECREKRRCVEEPDFASPFGSVSEIIECSDVGAADGQDPVGTKETVHHDPLAGRVALCIRDSDGRHPQVPLELLDAWSSFRIAEPQLRSSAQVERVEDIDCLVLGGIHQVDPEDLILVEGVESPGPVFDPLALSLVEEIGAHHPNIT
jgi:hypothetical protein